MPARFPSGREGSVINSDLGTEVCVRKSHRQPGGLSLSDCRQGHSLAPGQDEHVISSQCFPELEGGAHLLLLHPLPHSPTGAVGRGWSYCVPSLGGGCGLWDPRQCLFWQPGGSPPLPLAVSSTDTTSSLGHPAGWSPLLHWASPGAEGELLPPRQRGLLGWRDLGQRGGKVTSEDHL